MKKFISLVMTIVLVLGIGVFAEAEENILPIENTPYFYYCGEGSIDSYICDAKGNKLINSPFGVISGVENGNIIVSDSEYRNYGVYNAELELVVPMSYDMIYYEDNVFICATEYEDDLGYYYYEYVYLDNSFQKTSRIHKIGETGYYTITEDDKDYYICDSKGNILINTPFKEVNEGKSCIIVRSSDARPFKYGALDFDLNYILEEKYFRIVDDENIEAFLQGTTEIYNSKFELIETIENDLKFMTKIQGVEDRYIYNSFPEEYMLGAYSVVINEKGDILSKNYLAISDSVQPGNTYIAQYPIGHNDIGYCVLNSEFKVICDVFYGMPEIVEENGIVYIKHEFADNISYYDLLGNEYDSKEEVLKIGADVNAVSSWAKDSVESAVAVGIVPENLQGLYMKNITRKEFCQIAMAVYCAKTSYTVEDNSSPFTDVDDRYVTAAYGLGIVAGVGDNKFAPNKSITRQEAAVMLCNLAKALNLDVSKKSDKFIDEEYFADWAKESIYTVAGTKTGDTFIMVGTDENKFSPWMTYTREQAIVTMYRIFGAER